jgi:hypothetical protein
LEQEPGDHGGKDKPLLVHRRTERQPDQRGGGGVGFERPLDVPLPVEFGQAAVDGPPPGGGDAGDSLLGLAADLVIDVFGGVLRDTLDGRGDHGRPPIARLVSSRAHSSQNAR